MLFLLKKSKEFFDYDFGYSQTKKDFFSKNKIVIYFLHIFRKNTYKVLPPPPPTPLVPLHFLTKELYLN